MIDISQIELPKMPDPSAFRWWCSEKWMEHRDELFLWEKRFPEYDSTYYFRKHRWMLKKMFKEEQIEKYHKENKKEISKLVKRGFKKGNL